MPGGKCSFQDSWMEHDDSHPLRKLWVRRGKDKQSAFCSFCKKNVDVSHSGVNALTSHEKGKKHLKSENNFTSGKQLTLHSFNKSIETRPTGTNKDATGTKDDLSRPSCSASENLILGPKAVEASCTSGESNRSISNFLLNESVTKAEILWCAYCVTSHTSTRMGGTAVNIFPCMFPDSCIASKLQLQKDKIGYSVTYGLGPYFGNLVTSSVKRSPVFALSIDESLNDICQKQQLDVVANFWDNENDIISTKYVTSLFLEKSTALDMLDSFLGFLNTENLSLDNLVQLSTDGPNVNLKLLFDLNSHMKSTLSSEKQILDVGSCSLHIINGAYKTALKSVTWNLNQFLRASYRLFKNFPSRRGVYKQITGSSMFPQKFCAIRWIENSSVIQRSIEMLPHLKKYVTEIEKPPETHNFEIVKKVLNTDCTLTAKLHFSAMIALELEEFLTRFQRNAPLLPFMHQEVFYLMRSIASKFIKSSVMDKMSTGAKLCSLDLNCESNFKNLDSIDLGFGAISCLKNVKELDVQKFKLDCKKFLVALFKKLVLKSPLHKRVVLGTTCLNPKVMTNEVVRESRIKVAIEELIKHNQLTPAKGDIIKRAYLHFCQDGEVRKVLEKFNWKKDRLDTMFSELFKTQNAEDMNQEFVDFVKKLLVCFHSNAAVERSFSFNKEFLVENLEEKSLVAQRLLHDHINSLDVLMMLACVYQPRALQPPDPPPDKKPPMVIDRVPGRARKMVTSPASSSPPPPQTCRLPLPKLAKARVSPGDKTCDKVSSDKELPRVTLVGKDETAEKLRDGVELTLSELEEMACRQQQQIDSQRQLLAAKEQRLRFLKQHEARHQQVAAEHERLRRLRDRVEAQELKLRKLRALRGQVDQNKLNNASLTSDLDSIRALFNEKEKELSVAVAKVEELTRQLEELRRGRRENTPPSTAQELEKLRRELMYRNKLNEQQNARLTQQREALSQKQEEMASIDKRISELQDRLHRKRLLNQQLANQITAASNKANTSHQQQLRSTLSASAIQHHQQQQMYQQHGPAATKQLLRPLTAGNIAAIEPYHHVPSDMAPDAHSHPSRQPSRPDKPERRSHHLEVVVGSEQIYNHERLSGSQDDFNMKSSAHKNQNSPVDDGYKVKESEVENLPEFGASKTDPKYQTLPYNTKFTVNYVTHPLTGVKMSQRRPQGEGGERENVCDSEMVKNNNNSMNHVNNNVAQQLMSVAHSIPIPPGVNKGLATPLANQGKLSLSPSMMSSSSSTSSTSSLSVLGNLAPRVYNTSGVSASLLARGQPVGNSSPTNSSCSSTSSHQTLVASTKSVVSPIPPPQALTANVTNDCSSNSVPTVLVSSFILPPTSLSEQFQKPVSSVAPNTVQLPSPIYQTSSTKIHPVQPQTLSSTPQGILRDQKEELPLPPQPLPGEPPDSPLKPALPPKPALPVKPTPPPPPRQAHWAGEDEEKRPPANARPVDTSSEAVDTALSVLRGAPLLISRGSEYPSSQKPHSYQTQPPPPQPASAALVVSSDPLPPPPPTTEPPHDDLPKRPQDQIIKARPLTIRKQPPSEIPRLRNGGLPVSQGSEKSTQEEGEGSENLYSVETSGYSSNRRIEMPPAFLFPETEAPPADLVSSSSESTDQTDRVAPPSPEDIHNEDSHHSDKSSEGSTDVETRNSLNKEQTGDVVMRRTKKGNLKGGNGGHKQVTRRVSFDPLALLLDASLEGELELVVRTAGQVRDPSAANDEGITALHNAICAGHLDIVRFLVQFGCDVNAQDSDGWTPLHCAASCNNLAMVRFLVEHGACIFATTLSDHETAAEKCEEDEEGFDGCSEYLYSVQEKLGILNNGAVYAVFDYEAHNTDELSFKEGERMIVLRKGDEWEREWWWARLSDREGYIPRNLLGLYPRVHANKSSE